MENHDPKTNRAQSTIRQHPHQTLSLKPQKYFGGVFVSSTWGVQASPIRNNLYVFINATDENTETIAQKILFGVKTAQGFLIMPKTFVNMVPASSLFC